MSVFGGWATSPGSVITWGNNHEAMSCMKGVRMLLGVSGGAYVALTTDGHVRVWGDETAGGDSSTSALEWINALCLLSNGDQPHIHGVRGDSCHHTCFD